jgi:hypothetical protein
MAKGSHSIHGNCEAEFHALQQCLLADHQPATPPEVRLVHNMIRTYWRLELIRQHLDSAMLLHQADSLRRTDLLERSIARSERKYYKLLESLKKLQRRRLFSFVLQKQSPAA